MKKLNSEKRQDRIAGKMEREKVLQIIDDLKNTDLRIGLLCEKYGCSYHLFRKNILKHISITEYDEIIHRRYFRVYHSIRAGKPQRTVQSKKEPISQEGFVYSCAKCGRDYDFKPEKCGTCGWKRFEACPKVENLKTANAG